MWSDGRFQFSVIALLLMAALSAPSVGLAEDTCEGVVAQTKTVEQRPHDLIHQIWFSGDQHPIYRRPQTSVYFSELEQILIPNGYIAPDGEIQIEPSGEYVSGMDVVGSFQTYDNTLLISVVIAEMHEMRDAFAKGFKVQSRVDIGDQPKNSNLHMVEFMSAVMKVARKYAAQNPDIHTLRLFARNIRNEKLRAFLTEIGFVTSQHSEYVMEISGNIADSPSKP